MPSSCEDSRNRSHASTRGAVIGTLPRTLSRLGPGDLPTYARSASKYMPSHFPFTRSSRADVDSHRTFLDSTRLIRALRAPHLSETSRVASRFTASTMGCERVPRAAPQSPQRSAGVQEDSVPATSAPKRVTPVREATVQDAPKPKASVQASRAVDRWAAARRARFASHAVRSIPLGNARWRRT